MSVCPSARYNWAPTGRIFVKFDIIFRKPFYAFQVPRKFDKNNRYFTWRRISIYDHISLTSSYNEKFFWQELWRKCKHTRSTFKNLFSTKSCRLSDNVENIVDPERPQMTVWRMCIACWIPRSKSTYSKYIMLIDFLLQQFLQDHASLLHYNYIVSCYRLSWW